MDKWYCTETSLCSAALPVPVGCTGRREMQHTPRVRPAQGLGQHGCLPPALALRISATVTVCGGAGRPPAACAAASSTDCCPVGGV